LIYFNLGICYFTLWAPYFGGLNNLCTLLSVYDTKITVSIGMESVNISDDEDGVQLLTYLQIPVVIGFGFDMLQISKSRLLFSLLLCSVFYSAGRAEGFSIQYTSQLYCLTNLRNWHTFITFHCFQSCLEGMIQFVWYKYGHNIKVFLTNKCTIY
jgi:hypothetical protein